MTVAIVLFGLIIIVVIVGFTSFFRSSGGGPPAAKPGSHGAAPTAKPRSRGPRLPDHYFDALLAKAGFPRTEHNLFAVQEQIGIMFTTKVWQMMEHFGTEADWNTFLETGRYPTSDMHLWPQRVLDGLANWDAKMIPLMQDLPERYANILLEDVGRGPGFFGGSPEDPLPTANEWKMKA